MTPCPLTEYLYRSCKQWSRVPISTVTCRRRKLRLPYSKRKRQALSLSAIPAGWILFIFMQLVCMFLDNLYTLMSRQAWWLYYHCAELQTSQSRVWAPHCHRWSQNWPIHSSGIYTYYIIIIALILHPLIMHPILQIQPQGTTLNMAMDLDRLVVLSANPPSYPTFDALLNACKKTLNISKTSRYLPYKVCKCIS